MLYIQNLEELIFERHNIFDCDEIIIISGYLGPRPVSRLGELPIDAKVVYGMYGSEGIRPTLHNSLLDIQNSTQNLNIFYSQIPVHSKCYVWRRKNQIEHVLLGSANFSVNGLATPYREVLAETTRDTFNPLNEYLTHVLNNSISCLQEGNLRFESTSEILNECTMTLLDPRTGEVQNSAGLNWGQNPRNHTTPNDAYIPIRSNHIRNFPNLFFPKQTNPLDLDMRGRMQRHNDSVELLWDDGITMEGLFEGTYTLNDIIYPKQISSYPRKSQLGEYIRNRIGVPLGQPVRRHHLERYGRTDITLSLLGEGIYKVDFSPLSSTKKHARH